MITTVQEFARHLRRPAFSGDELLLAQRHLASAESVVASRCGLAGDGEQVHTVFPSGRQLVLPVWGPDLRVVEVRDPDGRVAAVDAATSRLHAGVVGVAAVRSGPWTVKVARGDGAGSAPPELVLAVLIIAAHLWETQQGRAARPQAYPGADERPSGMGYAIPNRAAELMAAHTLPTVA